jgi:hypothetical protein
MAVLLLVAVLAAPEVETRSVPGGCQQTVLVKHKGKVRTFVRHGRFGGTWGGWVEWPAPEPDINFESNKVQCIFSIKKPYPIPRSNKDVEKAMGKETFLLFHRRRRVRVSGWFNLSRVKQFDRKAFAGEHYP